MAGAGGGGGGGAVFFWETFSCGLNRLLGRATVDWRLHFSSAGPGGAICCCIWARPSDSEKAGARALDQVIFCAKIRGDANDFA
jgi:hypothetical protein